MEYLKRFKNQIIILSILYIILGLALLIWPQISLITICKFLGTIVLILGVTRLTTYFTNDGFRDSMRPDLAHGLLNILLGIFMLISPMTLVTALPIVLGIAIIVDSMLRIQLSIELKLKNYKNWWISLIFALLTAILGALLVFNPFAGGIILARYIGISLAIDGIVNLWVMFFMRKKLKEYDIL